MKILVTGAAGFIGCNLTRRLLHSGHAVVGLDKLTYAGSLAALAEFVSDPGFAFVRGDICDSEALDRVFELHQPDSVVHLAAESHVDRSIAGPGTFIQSNIVGTFRLLQSARQYFELLPAGRRERFRFLHVSTDEVFGSLDSTAPAFDENSRYDPRSPYSASKAASDHLVRAWQETFGLPVIVTRSSNNYGPWQHTEKLIPMVISRVLQGLPVPVYGTGENIRDWLHVDDHARALETVLTRAAAGSSWNIGASRELRNIDLVRQLCRILDELCPMQDPGDSRSGGEEPGHSRLIRFVADRPGHDWRYALDTTSIRQKLGWHPQADFPVALRETVEWYIAHGAWWRQQLDPAADSAAVPPFGQNAGFSPSSKGSGEARR